MTGLLGSAATGLHKGAGADSRIAGSVAARHGWIPILRSSATSPDEGRALIHAQMQTASIAWTQA